MTLFFLFFLFWSSLFNKISTDRTRPSLGSLMSKGSCLMLKLCSEFIKGVCFNIPFLLGTSFWCFMCFPSDARTVGRLCWPKSLLSDVSVVGDVKIFDLIFYI